MHSKGKGQAALEYLVTYGWAILGVMVALGALSYFGFMNPTNLLPDKCDFGKQLECADYQIKSDGTINLMLRNNFGKDIEVTAVDVRNEGITPIPAFQIESGKTYEVTILLDNPKPKREKADLLITLTFNRFNFAGSPSHNVTGTLFALVP